MTDATTFAHPAGSRVRDADWLYTTTKRAMFYILVLTVVGLVGFPLLWMLISSFKTAAELYQSPPTFLPSQATIENYTELYWQSNFGFYLLNSIIVATATTVLALGIGSIAAYSLSRFDFAGLNAFAGLTLVCYMLPEVLIVIPLYSIVIWLGLADTLYALILTNTAMAMPLVLWFMRAYFRSVPRALEECAIIDGCTRFMAFRKVTLPLAVPGLVSVGMLCFNMAYNEYLFALIFTSTDTKKVLSVGLATWINQENIYSWGMLLAGAVQLTLFAMALYWIVQRSIAAGRLQGSLQGE